MITVVKLLNQLEKDIAKEEKGAKDKALPDMLRFGHKEVLKYAKKIKRKIEEMK